MATTAEVNNLSNRIAAAAQAGTPNNPKGVPAALAALMVAQAKHETGNFSSRGFTLGNNAFGYSFVPGGFWQETQPGLIADNGAALAQYSSIERSTGEIVDWLYRRQSEGKFPDLRLITSPEQYALLLRNAGYYTDTLANYTAGLKRWLSALPADTKAGVGAGLAVGAVVFGVLMATRKRKSKGK